MCRTEYNAHGLFTLMIDTELFIAALLLVEPNILDTNMFGCLEVASAEPFVPEEGLMIDAPLSPYDAEKAKLGGYTEFFGHISVANIIIKVFSYDQNLHRCSLQYIHNMIIK